MVLCGYAPDKYLFALSASRLTFSPGASIRKLNPRAAHCSISADSAVSVNGLQSSHERSIRNSKALSRRLTSREGNLISPRLRWKTTARRSEKINAKSNSSVTNSRTLTAAPRCARASTLSRSCSLLEKPSDTCPGAPPARVSPLLRDFCPCRYRHSQSPPVQTHFI